MTSHTRLERRDRKKRMARFYSLSVQPNLFGGYSLICEWGRIGQRGVGGETAGEAAAGVSTIIIVLHLYRTI